MSTVAAVAFVVGTAITLDGQQKQASAQREQGRVSNAAQQAQDAETRRQQAREARKQKARIIASTEANGGGSRETGAISSLSTQLSSSSANMAGQANTANAITNLNNDISSAQVQAGIGQAVQSIGSVAFDKSGGFDNLFK